MEKISRINKAWSTRKSDTNRNTFAVQVIKNPTSDEMCEEFAKMRTELGLVLKHVSGGVHKVNVVECLTIPPLPVDVYYYEDSYE